MPPCPERGMTTIVAVAVVVVAIVADAVNGVWGLGFRV